MEKMKISKLRIPSSLGNLGVQNLHDTGDVVGNLAPGIVHPKLETHLLQFPLDVVRGLVVLDRIVDHVLAALLLVVVEALTVAVEELPHTVGLDNQLDVFPRFGAHGGWIADQTLPMKNSGVGVEVDLPHVAQLGDSLLPVTQDVAHLPTHIQTR